MKTEQEIKEAIKVNEFLLSGIMEEIKECKYCLELEGHKEPVCIPHELEIRGIRKKIEALRWVLK